MTPSLAGPTLYALFGVLIAAGTLWLGVRQFRTVRQVGEREALAEQRVEIGRLWQENHDLREEIDKLAAEVKQLREGQTSMVATHTSELRRVQELLKAEEDENLDLLSETKMQRAANLELLRENAALTMRVAELEQALAGVRALSKEQTP